MYLCVTLPMLFIFMESHAELLEVVGPKKPIIAVAGEDLVLPCNIKPSISAVDMTVEWYRLDVADMLVHLYKDREDRNEKQAQTYRGRTSVFKEELQKGNASLKLSALTLSDEGEYKCLVVDKSRSKDITVHVVVEVQGSKPVITMESYDNSGGINLVCGSRGWKPEPKVLWMDRNGVTLPAEDTQIYRDNELFSVKSRISVHVHDKSDSNRFYCRLQQNHHMKETEVIINSPFFAAGKWIVGISVLACLIAVGLIFISVLCYKKDQQKRTKEKEINELKNNAEQQIQAMGKDIKELKENAGAQKKRIEEQQNQKNNDDKQIKKLEEEIKELNNNAEVLKKRIEEMEKQKNNDDEQLKKLKEENQKLQNSSEEHKKKIEEQQKQKNNDDNKIKELKEENQKLQKDSEEHKKKIEEQQKQKNNDDNKIKKLEEDQQKQKTENEDQKKKIEEQQKQKKEDDEQIKNLKEENQKLQKDSEKQNRRKEGIQQPEDKSDVPPPQPTDENQST